MAKIITYNSPITGKPNQCYCQMKFEDGLKILISQSSDGIKIFKLFFGIIPTKVLFQAKLLDFEKHEKFINRNIDSLLFLDSYVETIKPMKLSKEFFEFIKD